MAKCRNTRPLTPLLCYYFDHFKYNKIYTVIQVPAVGLVLCSTFALRCHSAPQRTASVVACTAKGDSRRPRSRGSGDRMEVDGGSFDRRIGLSSLLLYRGCCLIDRLFTWHLSSWIDGDGPNWKLAPCPRPRTALILSLSVEMSYFATPLNTPQPVVIFSPSPSSPSYDSSRAPLNCFMSQTIRSLSI